MSFRLDTPYYSIPGSRPVATFGTVMEILLKTRVRLQMETQDLYDEDVNTYLAGLLVSYIDPEYLRAASEVLSQYDVDIFQAVTQASDRYQVYRIYKVNADDLLVSLGVFRRFCQEAGRGELVRVRRYYYSASEYQKRMYGKPTAVGEVQTKLADRPERYLMLLSGARRDYLHFIERLISPEELITLYQRIGQFEKELPLKASLDRFLDAYSLWLKGSRDPVLRQQLLDLTETLQNLDPAFPAEALKENLTLP